ncbi:cytochrome b5-like heme/steroid binding domain-containing protein [Calycina marina]|uniref:Cytochrome b5-like heme/steroid binding domain-containing protein n=1 Tax=Calycina marina TaxID=1763456 RepID=A0A9P7YY53_9HELO|nr:cytochrome b5-like heme/steroid binding domain-containing protein [Calycina marina]
MTGGKFEPKTPVALDPPKDTPISISELSAANGVGDAKAYVAIKGKVFDVTGNKMYAPEGSYHVFAGHDASYALGKTSTKPEDVKADWFSLDDKEKGVLADWETFFTKRYNIIGKVEGATNF